MLAYFYRNLYHWQERRKRTRFLYSFHRSKILTAPLLLFRLRLGKYENRRLPLIKWRSIASIAGGSFLLWFFWHSVLAIGIFQ